MSIYTILDSTGEVVSTLSAPNDNHATLNTPQGGSFLPGPPPANSYYVASTSTWVIKPAQPAPYYSWSASSKTWVDARPLAQAQSDQIATLEAAYDTAICAPVTFTSAGGITNQYQTDPDSIANLSSMLLAFQHMQVVPSGFYWLAADNTQTPFTYADMQGLATAIGSQGFTAFSNLQAKKAAVRAATSNSTVLSITWAS